MAYLEIYVHQSPFSPSNMRTSPALSPVLPPTSWSPDSPLIWNPLVISAVVLVVAIFFMLHFCKNIRSQWSDPAASLQGRHTEMQVLNETNPGDTSLQIHSHGLDTTILYSLPAVQFRKKNEGVLTQGDTDCAVCLGEFKEGDWLRYLPNCAHTFHISCIDTWFQSHCNCPLCRSNVLNNLTDHQGQSVSMLTLLDTLRREDNVLQERSVNHQVALPESSQNYSTSTESPTNEN